MQEVFSYIIGLGAAVMMPVIFTLLGVCIGIKVSKALKSGLLVGVGFVGLSVVTQLLTSSLGPSLNKMVEIYDLNLQVFDMGWPSAASVAYNTAVGAFIIPVCLGVNLLMVLTRTTKTVNIDLWNYWHFAFIGAIVYFASGSLLWGFFAAVICYIITLVMADLTAHKFQKFYKDMDGISIPQPFCQGFTPFAIGIGKLLDMIPGFDKAVAVMELGATVDIHLMPEEAYGPVDPNAIIDLKISQLPGSEDLNVGEQVVLTNAYGQQFPVTVLEKTEDSIKLDANHEMAGKELNFKIELVDIIEA